MFKKIVPVYTGYDGLHWLLFSIPVLIAFVLSQGILKRDYTEKALC